MEYPEEYFEDEVRCGFYVPSSVKRAWAVGLDTLLEVDRICKKYDIEYWVDWGTLIGAVRHNGFIPWDDDIDISMKRKDYTRFMQVAFQEIGDRFSLYTYRENKDYWGFVTRMAVKNRICFEPDHLKRCHQFPYIAGLDIFIWDYVDRDSEREAKRCENARKLIEFADEICTKPHDDNWIKSGLELIKRKTGLTADIEEFYKDKTAFRVKLYERAEEFFAMVDEKDADIMTRMMPNGLYYVNSLRIPKQYFDDTIYVDFENIKVPVPLDYDEMLRIRYGDYMRLVKNQSGHDYPFFASQEKSLEEILAKENIKLNNDFSYRKLDRTTDNSNSYKNTIRECLGAMSKYVEDKDLINLQQTAIDLGEFIERIKGEGTESVSSLEGLCEAIFNVYENGADFSEIKIGFNNAGNIITEQILNRRLTVFLLTKASKWKFYEEAYKAKQAEGEALIIPIPYHHKNFDGSFVDTIWEYENFAKFTEVTDYRKFDLSLFVPDEIFIETPFDEYNNGISVDPKFYTINIRKYTDILSYIPDFILDDFSEQSEREYLNMKYYCLVPGVAYADNVYVNSKQTAMMYEHRLQKNTGIKLNPWPCKVSNPLELKPEWKKFLENNHGKKLLMYFCGISEFLHNKENYLAKMKENFEIFEENSEKLAIMFSLQDGISEILNKKYPELLPELATVIETAKSKKFIMYIDNKDLPDAEEIATAYYGDVNSIIQTYRNDGKPVMIQKVLF